MLRHVILLTTLLLGAASDRFGVGLLLTESPDGHVVVVDVIAGAPAESAGLRSGDIVLAVDGRSLAGSKLEDAVQMLSRRNAQPLEIEIYRDGPGRTTIRVAPARVSEYQPRTVSGDDEIEQIVNDSAGKLLRDFRVTDRNGEENGIGTLLRVDGPALVAFLTNDCPNVDGALARLKTIDSVPILVVFFGGVDRRRVDDGFGANVNVLTSDPLPIDLDDCADRLGIEVPGVPWFLLVEGASLQIASVWPGDIEPLLTELRQRGIGVTATSPP